MSYLVRISNERLWELSHTWKSGELVAELDSWLLCVVGYANYTEIYPEFNWGNVPYRQFEFVNEEDSLLFAMTWL